VAEEQLEELLVVRSEKRWQGVEHLEFFELMTTSLIDYSYLLSRVQLPIDIDKGCL
jgi:hypothetical protein